MQKYIELNPSEEFVRAEYERNNAKIKRIIDSNPHKGTLTALINAYYKECGLSRLKTFKKHLEYILEL